MLVEDGDFDDQFVLQLDEGGIEEEGKHLLPGDELNGGRVTAKANIAKRQLSRPEGYNLMILGDYTSSSPSY